MTRPTRKLRKLSLVVLAGVGVTIALADAARAAPCQDRRASTAQRRQWARDCLARIYSGENVDGGDMPAHFVGPRAAAA